MNLFKPMMYKKSIFDVDYQKLKELGVKLIVFDLDNTIGCIKDAMPSEKTINLVNDLKKSFKVVVASNNLKKRVRLFCEKLNCDYFYRVFKPSIKMGLLIKKRYNVSSSNACIIGDQLVTDILIGNRLKMVTVLVDPIGEKDLKITKLNRIIEKHLMKKNNIIKGEYYG